MSLKYSAEGVKALERELTGLKEDLRKLQIYKNQIAAENGDVWHDNNDFEQSEIEERRLKKSIADLEKKIKTVEVISPTTFSDNTVNYGAIVKLKIFGEGFSDEMTILFSDSDEKTQFQKISLNSPVGKAIYEKTIGFVGHYTVGKEFISVEILDIQYSN